MGECRDLVGLNCKSRWSWVDDDDFGSGIFGEVEEEFPRGKLME
jgi:hypothetical protein